MQKQIGSIVLETNANNNLMATGHFGFSAVIKKGMGQEEIEKLMALQMMAGDAGFAEAVFEATFWAA